MLCGCPVLFVQYQMMQYVDYGNDGHGRAGRGEETDIKIKSTIPEQLVKKIEGQQSFQCSQRQWDGLRNGGGRIGKSRR